MENRTLHITKAELLAECFFLVAVTGCSDHPCKQNEICVENFNSIKCACPEGKCCEKEYVERGVKHTLWIGHTAGSHDTGEGITE